MHERTDDAEGERPLRRTAKAVAIGALGLLLGGCFSPPPGSLTQGTLAQGTLAQGTLADASAQFSERFQCPLDRVSAGFDVAVVKPPALEVAADPERLAMYRRQTAVELGSVRFAVVRGCGQGATYTCVSIETRHHGERIGCVMSGHGKLGVDISTITRTIDRVEPGGLGERLGFRAGDVLIGLDHTPRSDIPEYVRLLNDPGSRGHVITVLRGGVQQVDILVPHLED